MGFSHIRISSSAHKDAFCVPQTTISFAETLLWSTLAYANDCRPQQVCLPAPHRQRQRCAETVKMMHATACPCHPSPPLQNPSTHLTQHKVIIDGQHVHLLSVSALLDARGPSHVAGITGARGVRTAALLSPNIHPRIASPQPHALPPFYHYSPDSILHGVPGTTAEYCGRIVEVRADGGAVNLKVRRRLPTFLTRARKGNVMSQS